MAPVRRERPFKIDAQFCDFRVLEPKIIKTLTADFAVFIPV
jgi:hypothetical protein